MKDTYNGWSNIKWCPFEKVVDLVLTNGDPDNLNSDYWILDIIKNNVAGENLNILDFGVGIGRNIFNFSKKHPNWSFTGYDNEHMLKFTEQYCVRKFNHDISNFSNVRLESNWDVIVENKYDCIYSTIVLQHIYEDALNVYLNTFKKITNFLIVAGRRLNDDNNKNTWEILEKNGLHPINSEEIGYSVDGDPHEHITCVYDLSKM